MSMIRIEFDDLARRHRALEKLQSRHERRNLMDTIGAYGESSTRQRFIDGVGPDGEQWKESGRVRAQGGQTLRDEGRLMNSITFEASPDHAEWGSNLIYAGIHQVGGRITAKNAKALVFNIGNQTIAVKSVDIPARPFLGISAEDEREIGHIVNDWADGVWQ